MMRSFLLFLSSILLLAGGAAAAQVAPPPSGPIAYASANEVNALLGQLDSTAQKISATISRLRISKWKVDSGTRQQEQANAESIQRNLQSALPALISAVRSNPDDLAASFRLFRNLDALYDVMSNVTESAGAFGARDDYQALDSSFNTLDHLRRSFADRMENLASTQQSELAQLRAQVRTLQGANPATPPKKVIVDDNEPPKKPVRKKKPAPAKPKTAPPAAGTSPSPPQ